MKEVILNIKEQKRLLVLNEILAGRIAGQEAAEVLGLSLRHTRRLIAAYRQEGAAVLAHGNRGKQSHRRTPKAVEEKIVTLVKDQYHDYNNCHFAEELEERHGISVSSSTVRRIRQRHGLPVRARGGYHVIGGGASAIHRVECCCKWMAASTIGWKAEDPG